LSSKCKQRARLNSIRIDELRKLAINRLARACRVLNIPVIWFRHNIHSKGKGNDGGIFHLFHDKKRNRILTDFGDVHSTVDIIGYLGKGSEID
jgi:hypothetical protein